MNRELIAKEILALAKELLVATSSGEPKQYYLMDNVGHAKYTVNYHDGVSTHKDGSAFYDIAIFRNKPSMEAFINELARKGYRERNSFRR
jgi:hypothetical protein